MQHSAFAKMGKMMCLVVLLFLFASVVSFQVNDLCEKEYDLNYEVRGYRCQFVASGVYVVEGGEVDYVRFLSLDLQSYVYVNTNINSIIIESGSINLCKNVLYGRGTVGKVIVNEELCVSIYGHPDNLQGF